MLGLYLIPEGAAISTCVSTVFLRWPTPFLFTPRFECQLIQPETGTKVGSVSERW